MSAEARLEEMGPRPCAACGDDLRASLRLCSTERGAYCGSCGAILAERPAMVEVPAFYNELGAPRGSRLVAADAVADWDDRLWRQGGGR